MTRGVGAIDVVQSVLPEWLVPVVAGVTHLGDAWFYLLLLPPLYWFGPGRGLFADREDAGTFVGLTLAAFALVVGLKAVFALPRPPADLHLVAAEGYGFPSGHALGSTAVYGGLAVLLDRWSAGRRLAAAAVLAGAIALSRVALGVHYLADVVAGALVGAAVLGALVVARRRGRAGATRVVWLAAGLGVLAAAASAAAGGPSETAAQTLGATVGAALAWTAVDDRRARAGVGIAAGLATLVVLAGAWVAADALDAPLPVIVLVNAVVLGGIVALPGLPAASGRGR